MRLDPLVGPQFYLEFVLSQLGISATSAVHLALVHQKMCSNLKVMTWKLFFMGITIWICPSLGQNIIPGKACGSQTEITVLDALGNCSFDMYLKVND